MLVLTRKIGEKVVIDGDITVTITEIKGDKVRIGIEAPAAVSIFRSELVAPSALCEVSSCGQAERRFAGIRRSASDELRRIPR